MKLTSCLTAVLLSLGIVGLWAGNGAHGDEEVARFLLAQAKKAISLRHHDEAIQKLLRVQEEDPKLVEALYLLGQVYEKQKEPGKALGAYRGFRDACAKLGEALDQGDQRLLTRALARIAVLGKGEAELDKLLDAFAKEVVKFARVYERTDTDIAVDALRRLVEARPGDKEGTALLAKLGGTDEAEAVGLDPKEVPIPGITKWVDLLAKRLIPPGGKTSYKRKVLTFDQADGSVFWTDPDLRAPEVFVYDMEFRFLKEHAQGYLIGPVFGRDEKLRGDNEFVTAFAQKTLVTMTHASGGKNIDIAQTAVSPILEDAWHRITVAVEGRKVQVYFDGKRVLSSSVPGRKSLAGTIGVFHQRCVAEVRSLRLGTKE